MNVVCLYIDNRLKLSTRNSNLNVFEPRNQSVGIKADEWCRTFEIGKGLDNYVFDDFEISRLKSNILEHIPDLGTETRLKFVLKRLCSINRKNSIN